MSRIVLHERNRPYLVKAGDHDLYVCACGLSEDKPLCDGHHKKTLDEKDGTFIYDSAGNRVKIESQYRNP